MAVGGFKVGLELLADFGRTGEVLGADDDGVRLILRRVPVAVEEFRPEERVALSGALPLAG